jgi:hypothetical protein
MVNNSVYNYSGFLLIGSPVNWGKSWRTKTNREYYQNLIRLFGAPCCLIGPENAKNFHAPTIVFGVIIKTNIVMTQLLHKLQRNTRRHQNTRKPMRMTRPSVNEWLSRMLGNLLLDYDFISRQSYVYTRNLMWFCSVEVNHKNTAGYTQSIPPSLTVTNYMRV